MKKILCAALFLTLIPLYGSVLTTGADELAVLRDKAEQGDAVAQYNLGVVYADPSEPSYNPVEAYVWLRLAATHGATNYALSRLTATLTQAQLVAAQKVLASRGGPPAPGSPAPNLSTQSQASTSGARPANESPPDAALSAARQEADHVRIAYATQQVQLASRDATVKLLNSQLAELTATLASRERELAKITSGANPGSDTIGSTATAMAELARFRQDNIALTQELSSLRQQLTATQQELAATKLILASRGNHQAASTLPRPPQTVVTGPTDAAPAINLVQFASTPDSTEPAAAAARRD